MALPVGRSVDINALPIPIEFINPFSPILTTIERGPYPQRFFMGLAWYHTELGKGISFEKMQAIDKPEDLSRGDLAINHIRFRILDELIPNGDAQTLAPDRV
jgi:hypothetical protein